MKLSISEMEHLDRQRRFFANLQEQAIDAAILFNATDIFYLTGFHFFVTERPIGFFISPQGNTHLFVPSLEHQHAEEYACVEHVHSYPEYPGLRHPMEYLKDALLSSGFSGKTIGIDADGYASSMGYSGPRISELLPNKLVSIHGWIEQMRKIKSPTEIELLRESCRWGNLAHRLLQKYAKPGRNELEIMQQATMEATSAMVDTLGADYRPHGSTATAYFRGQVGKLSAFPHVVTQNAVLRKGDNLVTMAKADVWGYHTELERTMFVQEVGKEQEKYFKLMIEAQEVAFRQIKPGVPASSIQQEVHAFFEEQGILHLVRHHTGHAMGLLEHEAPFFDLGDHTILQQGMVFAVEPGIYVEGLGGFRHSDTVLVTADGMEILTYYPRDLESLVCE